MNYQADQSTNKPTTELAHEHKEMKVMEVVF